MYPYLVQQAPSRHTRTEERMLHLFRLFNVLLEKRPESRKRALLFHVPRMVPLNIHVRLVQDDTTMLSLEDVFDEHAKSSMAAVATRIKNEPGSAGVHAQRYSGLDAALMRCYALRRQDRLSGRDGRKVAFDTVRAEVVPSDVLSNHLRATFPDHMALFAFQKQFTAQTALSALASHVLLLGKGAPHVFRFIPGTGNIVPREVAPVMNVHGLLANQDPVPFRLTPNLVNFLTPMGIIGVFFGAFVAAAHTLHDPDLGLREFLGVIFRDEAISWHANSRDLGANVHFDNDTLVGKLDANVTHVLRRLKTVAVVDSSNGAVENLIKHATSSTNLCQMPPTWHPWL